MALIVRSATPADLASVGVISVDAYRAAGQLADESGRYAQVLADAASRAEAAEVLVAVGPGGAVVGSVTFCVYGQRYAELAGPGEAEFRMLAVSPAAQGLGAGEALVRSCLARAVELGCTALVLCTREEAVAAPAWRLYKKIGFVRTPERDWQPVPDVDLHAWRLELPVNAGR